MQLFESREAFLSAAGRRLAERGASARPEVLLLLAPDGSTRLSDALGHARARMLSRAIAGRLALCAPECPCAAVGQHEFALLCPLGPGARPLEELWAELQALLALPLCGEWGETSLCFSAGVARLPRDWVEPEGLLDAAAAALHRAQQLGGGRCLEFQAGFLEEARANLELENALRHALERRELRVHYQPVVDCQSGELAGLEALLRWQQPSGTWIPPASFVPLAEQSELIHELGDFVLREVLGQRAIWKRAGSALAAAHVSLNLSARQLDDERFVERIEEARSAGELAGAPLWLELTETALVSDGAAARERLVHLRQLGLKLALDDLGTGYSSLLELRELPLDAFKIDRRLCAGIGSDARSTRLFESLCGLARSIPLCLVVEGIETQVQLAVLRRLRCRLGQGFLWSAALPPAELERWQRCRFRHSA